MKEIRLNTRKTSCKNYLKFVALVSDEDFERVNKYNWCVDIKKTNAYAVAKIDKKNVFLHRFIMKADPGTFVDHINGNGLDCRRENLRFVTAQQNRMNCCHYMKATSKFKGVSKDNKRAQWGVYIGKKRIGYFDNEEEAAKAYDQQAIIHYGQYARLNFPERQVA